MVASEWKLDVDSLTAAQFHPYSYTLTKPQTPATAAASRVQKSLQRNAHGTVAVRELDDDLGITDLHLGRNEGIASYSSPYIIITRCSCFHILFHSFVPS